jgi:hypothetical protein
MPSGIRHVRSGMEPFTPSARRSGKTGRKARLVRAGPIPGARERGADVRLRFAGAVDRGVDDTTHASAATEDDAVGVALNPVQHLSVTDHRRSFRRPPAADKDAEDEHSANITRPEGSAITVGTMRESRRGVVLDRARVPQCPPRPADRSITVPQQVHQDPDPTVRSPPRHGAASGCVPGRAPQRAPGFSPSLPSRPPSPRSWMASCRCPPSATSAAPPQLTASCQPGPPGNR